MYLFSRVGPSSRANWGGAAHTTEIPYVFDITHGDTLQFEERDHTISRAMADGLYSSPKPATQTVVRRCLNGLLTVRLISVLDFGDRITVGFM